MDDVLAEEEAALERVEAFDEDLADHRGAEEAERKRQRDLVLPPRPRLFAEPPCVGVEDEAAVDAFGVAGCPVQPGRIAPVLSNDGSAA